MFIASIAACNAVLQHRSSGFDKATDLLSVQNSGNKVFPL
jgi:hypothetical protein